MSIKDLSIADLCGLMQYTSNVLKTEVSESAKNIVLKTRELVEEELLEKLFDIIETTEKLRS